MSVNRYDVEAYSWFGTAHWNLVESEVGDIIRASDYDELRERVAWMLECDEFLEWINPTNRRRAMFCYPEMRHIFNAASKAVEELL